MLSCRRRLQVFFRLSQLRGKCIGHGHAVKTDHENEAIWLLWETVAITRGYFLWSNGYIQTPHAMSIQVDGKHMIWRICTPAKVHNIYYPTLVLLSFCFALLIMITMCQLSKCLFCVWVQRTDEVYDDRNSTQKQQQRLCQIYCDCATETDGAIIG